MIQIGQTLVSNDLTERYFFCDLEKCKGMCCVKGDAGAPLTSEEVMLLPELIGNIKPYLRKEGIKAIAQQGTHCIDSENETVTPLVDGKECAYVVFEDKIARCGIEKAFIAGAISFRKPVSCHLYPVRIKKYEQFTAVNYDKWDICEPARIKGENEHTTVFQYIQEALIRRFGMAWFQDFAEAIEHSEVKNNSH